MGPGNSRDIDFSQFRDLGICLHCRVIFVVGSPSKISAQISAGKHENYSCSFGVELKASQFVGTLGSVLSS